ncbi:MAG: hypothetical protein ACOWWM_03340 [Desulfobacterales bacterium]
MAVPSKPAKASGTYSCKDYRQEMILIGLRRRLLNPDLSDREREVLMEAVRQAEAFLEE